MPSWHTTICRSFASLNHQQCSQAYGRVSRFSSRSFSSATPADDGKAQVDAELTPPQPNSAHSSSKTSTETQGSSRNTAKRAKRKKKKASLKSRVIPPTALAPALPLPDHDLGVINETWAKEPWADVVEERGKPDNIQTATTKEPVPIRKGVILDVAGPPLKDVKAIKPQLPIDQLDHGLSRVLFNPGVHWLQDPRSKVYNFTPWLEKIPKPNSFAFEKLTGFISSSKDTELRDIAKREGVQFVGSTSSLSGALSHIYYLLSRFHPLNLSRFSRHLRVQPTKFTAMQRKAVTIRLVYDQGVYSVDAVRDPLDVPDKNILVWLGTLMENFLTKTSDNFKKLLRLDDPVEVSNASPASPSVQKETTGDESTTDAAQPVEPRRPAYRYAKGGNIVTRSQLDCFDPHLPGGGVFDIKTRACVSIRMDILNFAESSGYLIKQQHGLMQSFEREYYDLIRSAFLKYNFQIRIGGMDGVFVTYHNTERIFGFQYIPITEIDECLFGRGEGVGDKVFKKCMTMLEGVLEEAAACFPNQSIDCTLKTLDPGHNMEVWVTPTDVDPSIPTTERPRALLNVTVKHKLAGKDATATECIRYPWKKWATDYTISRVDKPVDVLNDKYRRVLPRTRKHILPSGLTPEEGPEFMEKLNFGNQPRDPDAPVLDASAFAPPTRFHLLFRRLSRRGRLTTNELEARLRGIPKIVHGGGVYTKDGRLLSGIERYPWILRALKRARDGSKFRKGKTPSTLKAERSSQNGTRS